MILFTPTKNSVLVAGLTLALLSGAAVAQAVPTAAPAFTEHVAALIGKATQTRVEVKNELSVTVGHLTMDLGRVFHFCQNNEPQCATVLDDYAKSVAGMMALRNAPVKKEAVRVLVRSDEYVRRSRQAAEGRSPPLAVRPLANGLWAAAVLDTPTSLRLLNHDDFRKLELTEEEVFALGSRNVTAELGPLSTQAKPVAKGRIGLLHQGAGAYESGRVVNHADWAALAQAQGGVLLVAVPATDVVLYSSENTPQAVLALKEAAIEVAKKAPTQVSSLILKWTPQGWETVG